MPTSAQSRKAIRKRKTRNLFSRISLFKLATIGLTTLVLAVSLHFVAAAPSRGTSLPNLYGANPGANVLPNALVIKLQPGIVVNEHAGTISGGDAAQVAALNKYLVAMKRSKLGRVISVTSAARSPRVASAVDRYYTVTFANNINVVHIAQQLQFAYSSVIAEAYPVARPASLASTAPLPTIPSYTANQNYFSLAPTGEGAVYARNFPGGKGDRVRVTDIEYSWNINHVDLTTARNALVLNGTPVIPQSGDGNDHGTKVIGMIAAQDNGFGITGGTPNVSLSLINAWNTSSNAGNTIVDALALAESISNPGDVVLIELQTTGPDGRYVPIEWDPAVYDSIKALTDKGVIFIEPAANGSVNLDNTALYGSPFPLGKPDSGAIMVGGGVNCYYSTNRLSPGYYTDYGARVNVQGAGDCVATTGRGTLNQNTTDPNQMYASDFDGTSAASAEIASAAASLSSAYKQLNGGKVLTPAQIRSILMATGTPESTAAPYGTTEAIGPLPNLQKALQAADLVAPTAPTVKVSMNRNHKPVVTWSGATDNVAVTKYKLYRNGSAYKTLAVKSFTDTAVSKGKTYAYKVVAFDDAGHASPASHTVKIVVK